MSNRYWSILVSMCWSSAENLINHGSCNQIFLIECYKTEIVSMVHRLVFWLRKSELFSSVCHFPNTIPQKKTCLVNKWTFWFRSLLLKRRQKSRNLNLAQRHVICKTIARSPIDKFNYFTDSN